MSSSSTTAYSLSRKIRFLPKTSSNYNYDALGIDDIENC